MLTRRPRLACIRHHGTGGALRLGTMLLAFAIAASVQAQGWKPERAVEMVVGTAAGSGADKIARTVQKIMQDRKLLDVAVNVINRPGGGGAVAYGYLHQRQGDAHLIALVSKSLLTSHITGASTVSHADLTLLAHLNAEYISVAVKADSPIRTGRDLIERLRKDPAALSVGVATALGGTNHQAVAAVLREAGIDVRKTRNVVFQSGAAAITAMLGGHIDVVPGTLGLMFPHHQSGQIRVIAVAAPRRVAGVFAEVPTWREQGYNAIVSNWRSMVGARGMTAPQIAYWEAVLQRLADSEEWKLELDRSFATADFMGAAETRKYLDADYAQLRAFLTDLGLAK